MPNKISGIAGIARSADALASHRAGLIVSGRRCADIGGQTKKP
jgi:hypothetical protein